MSNYQLIIFVKDNNKDSNYKLMAFLHKNVKTTTSFGTRIIPKIIPKFQEKEFYNKYKIDKLPAAIYNKESYIGQDRIKELIKVLCKNKEPLRKKNEDELAAEDLRDYHQSIMDTGDEDEVSDDIEGRKMQAAMWSKERMEGMSDKPPEVDHYKDMRMGEDTPIVSDRQDNISSDHLYNEIQEMAHEGGQDDEYMDALLEKIRGANAD